MLNVVEICRAEANAKNLHVYPDLRAGAHHVSADTAKFQQIIWNLLKNAIKFTGEDGEITISSSNPAPQTIVITVRDT
ncbi:MAG: hybrid sensor histidine kinase/response regulator, partial [Verrucomicrobia bacterium]